jgi:ribosomal protein S12 methylthiotransferase accessory factor YcaO
MTNGTNVHLERQPRPPALHPAWLAFVRFCSELKFGEIERLSIQDGLPVLAETTKKKIKFKPE